MAKSIFGINVSGNFPHESILNLSRRLISLFKCMVEKDKALDCFKYVKPKNGYYLVDLSKSNIEEELAMQILTDYRVDIAKHEKETNPTIEYSRDFGFNPLFQIFQKNQKLCDVFTNLGASGGGISLTNFNREIEKDFVWYYSTLTTMVDALSPQFAFVTLRNTAFNTLFAGLHVKYVIGWITYFSKDFDLKIPDDLPGFEYVFTDKGKYLILSREDITLDKTTYEYYRGKLIDTMKFLKEQVPGYSK